MKKYPAKKVVKSKPIDMVYEGIGKQKAAQKELRGKRLASKAAHEGKKIKGALYKGRYD